MNACPWPTMRAKYLFVERDQRAGDSQLPLLSVSASRGVVLRSEVSDSEPRADDLRNYKMCVAGDLVINRMSAYQGALGVARQAGIVSPDYAVLRPTSRIEPRFLHHLSRSSWFVNEMTARLRGIGGSEQGNVRTPRINIEDLGQIRVAIPDAGAQRQIACFLDAETARIDALIVKRQRMMALLDERFRVRVRAAVIGSQDLPDPLDVRPKDITRPGWTILKLPWDLQFGSGTTPPTENESYYGGNIPWIVTGNLRDTEIAGELASVTEKAVVAFSTLRVYPRQSLVVAMYGATVGRLGIMTVPSSVNQACCVIYGGSKLRLKYLFYWLYVHREALLERSVGSGQPNISQEILRAIRIAVPDLPTQDKVVARSDEDRHRVNRAVTALRNQIALLREHHQALVTAAVTGQLDSAKAAA
jgi:type I restriction enzyme, S subunit